MLFLGGFDLFETDQLTLCDRIKCEKREVKKSFFLLSLVTIHEKMFHLGQKTWNHTWHEILMSAWRLELNKKQV